MKPSYDFIYLTNTPSFYKLNLCHEIARQHSLLLVLYGYGSEAVNKVLTGNSGWAFDYYFLDDGDAHRRHKLRVLARLLRLMRRVQCRKVLYAGWLAPEYNLYAFLSPRHKNVMVCESSVFDVSFSGLKGELKRAVIHRMESALPSGIPHRQLFERIGFRGTLHITGSVGIFNKGPRNLNRQLHQPLRYLYVGRLVEVKNVSLLIEEFNRNGKSLTIVGSGILESALRQKAQTNIRFTGFVANEQLGAIYQAHDVFILPSCHETWGLVVEEALYWGLPVIVSNRVGSSIDMVKNLGTGVLFQSNDPDSLHAAIGELEQQYCRYLQAVRAINWQARDEQQVEAYTSLLSTEQ